ncbi:endonuclease III [Candidatus Nesciobacter abundans]|uniref:Endonuclease III n=1 Tax=Candidatus Nesciobacter abundans TaxID=2601668 RepID=A0A5C0UKA8_9PROT|nr:endonuclease III [Candidatus Nesciobacter abundans]QEK39294.1 endonuclease III [Candidatus Nesciobacter abundans]
MTSLKKKSNTLDKPNLTEEANILKRSSVVFEKLSESKLPETIALNYENHYTLLVAVILSAQSKDEQVNKITPNLFKVASTPSGMIELGLEKLIDLVKSIGLYRNKSKNIIEASKILAEKYNSIVPDTMEELIELPGVGRKTANVILNFAFKKPTMPVDTHVLRVSRRLGLTKEKTPEKVERDLLKIVPEKLNLEAHNLLVWHGRNVCQAKKPDCKNCCLKDICESEDKII